MIGLQIDDSALARQVQALAAFEPALRDQFAAAGDRTGRAMQKDLRGGVARRTGALADGINSEVKPQGGVEVDLIVGSTASNSGYDYGARLNADGRMTWRAGKYAGRRTWGWFSYAGPRVARRLFKRNYQLALDKTVRQVLEAG